MPGLAVYNTLAAITASAAAADGQTAYVQSASSPGDGGGGYYRWNASSTATADGVSIIQVTGVTTGRWFKAPTVPNVSAKGAVSGSVTIDLLVATYHTMSAAANITVSISNVTTPAFLLIEFKHTAAGTTITNLPGKLLSDFSWSTGINDITMIYGIYNGTEWKWSTSLYQVPNLGSIVGLASTPSGTTIINLSWSALANATNYTIDRATNVGFTTGVSLGIYSGSGTSFSDTGLTTGTQYFYRIKATASGFNDSPYSTSSATTGVTLIDLTFPTVVSLANTGTVWRPTDTAVNFNCYGLSAYKLPAGVDGYIQHTYTATDAAAGMLVFSTFNTNKKYTSLQYHAGVFFSGGTIWRIDNGANGGTTTGVAMAVGNMVRVRRAGSVLTVEKSTDSGVTWPTLVYTFVFSSTADLFINMNIEGVPSGTNRVYDPKGFAVV